MNSSMTAALAGFMLFASPLAIGADSGGASLGMVNREPISRLRDEIARVGNVGEARALALAPIDQGLEAVDKVLLVMPFSRDLRSAESSLSSLRLRVAKAESPEQVADEFAGTLLAGLDDDSLASVQAGSHGCSYSTGEVVAIVIGLILGIIPGLILLAVLC